MPKDERATAGQRFTVNLAESARFEGGGLRDFFAYRDLGIGSATGGRYHAHVIKANEAVARGTGRHRHELEFQLVYVLKGRVTFWYDGEGEFDLGPGDCVLQPSGIRHELVRCSGDLEMLEITAPADFPTIPAD